MLVNRLLTRALIGWYFGGNQLNPRIYLNSARRLFRYPDDRRLHVPLQVPSPRQEAMANRPGYFRQLLGNIRKTLQIARSKDYIVGRDEYNNTYFERPPGILLLMQVNASCSLWGLGWGWGIAYVI